MYFNFTKFDRVSEGKLIDCKLYDSDFQRGEPEKDRSVTWESKTGYLEAEFLIRYTKKYYSQKKKS